jgi:hypothetical protein
MMDEDTVAVWELGSKHGNARSGWPSVPVDIFPALVRRAQPESVIGFVAHAPYVVRAFGNGALQVYTKVDEESPAISVF